MQTEKLIIFDLDGVLIDSKELHFQSLNKALQKIDSNLQIQYNEHLAIYDGQSTNSKLKLLTKHKGLDPVYYSQIWHDKQKFTIDLIKQLRYDQKLIKLFHAIKSEGIKIAVASNSIRETVKFSLLHTGLMEFVDYYVSNEDVQRPKPYPEMYWQCMTALNAIPKTTVIFEDSHIGRTAAINSGATLIEVKNCHDLNKNKIQQAINVLNETTEVKIPWIDRKLNVLIPMAGAGSRFSQAGFTFPKPLIEVHNKPMIQLVVENLNIDAHYIFLVQKEHYVKYNLKQVLNLIAPNCDIIQVDGVTEGAACTTLLAKDFINNNNPLLIANSDQYIEWSSNECLYAFNNEKTDGGILTFNSTHPKWSFAKLDSDGFVELVAEKNPISNIATVGVYYWKQGQEYVKYAEQMIEKNIRVNNEFYVCPVFNEAIQDGLKFKTFQIEKMWGLGTPEDLDYFIKNYDINRT